MSIYATLWKLKFPCDIFDPVNGEWVEVTAQAVPAHVGTPTPGFGYEDGDPFTGFLPPAIEVDADGDAPIYRAVVLVTPETKKGTPRNGQEYVDPLLCHSNLATGSLCKNMKNWTPSDRPSFSSFLLP
jgi:hypothetical protein